MVLQVPGEGTGGIGTTHPVFLPLWDLVDRCHICRIPRAQLGRDSVSHVFMERPVCSSELRALPYFVTYVRQPGPDLSQWAIGKAPSLGPQLHTLLLDLNSTVF